MSPGEQRSPTYWKVPFERPGDRAQAAESDPPYVGWRRAGEVRELTQLVARVLSASVDAWDIAAVRALGAEGAAREVLREAPGFSHAPAWWQVVTVEGAAAGFVLPVIYDGCARDGLDEATIYHVGVDLEQRGRGLGRLLLRRATQTLLTHGVWQISCDTAANNAAMIHLFEGEGWKRLPAHERPVFAPGRR